ncbi:MAG: hypothetical protein ACK4HQ_07090, partial [Brevinematales bacterium]
FAKNPERNINSSIFSDPANKAYINYGYMRDRIEYISVIYNFVSFGSLFRNTSTFSSITRDEWWHEYTYILYVPESRKNEIESYLQ